MVLPESFVMANVEKFATGQEDQLSALGFTMNAVVLWNTLYMDAARNYLEQKSVKNKMSLPAQKAVEEKLVNCLRKLFYMKYVSS